MPQSSLCNVPDDAAHVVAHAGLSLCGKGCGVGKLTAGVRVVGHGKPVIWIFRHKLAALHGIERKSIVPFGPLPHVTRQRYLIPSALPPRHVAHRILKEVDMICRDVAAARVRGECAYLKHVRESDEEPPPDLRVVQPCAPHPRHDVCPVGRVVAHHVNKLKEARMGLFFDLIF